MGSGWRIEERTGSAAALHEAWPATVTNPSERAIGICTVSAPAVVLGSTQQLSVVDSERAQAAGVVVARRRSGGGAVLVTPADPIWVDAWIPRGDPLWLDDVARAFDWVGDTWGRVLEGLGITGVSVHRDGLAACTSWSSLVCFGGVGTGEVLDADGRKVVGISQRRTRAGAWFHGACLRRWEPGPLLDVLALDADQRVAAQADLAEAATGIDQLLPSPQDSPRVDASSVVSEFIKALPGEG
jgi:lipoate-protein ligase A